VRPTGLENLAECHTRRETDLNTTDVLTMQFVRGTVGGRVVGSKQWSVNAHGARTWWRAGGRVAGLVGRFRLRAWAGALPYWVVGVF
jgi:hypothetical protein